MKKRILFTIMLVICMVFGSVITCHAATTGARATRQGITTNDGTYIAYSDMECANGYEYSFGLYTDPNNATYSKYNDYAIDHYDSENKEIYHVVFVVDGQSPKMNFMESQGIYYPRLSCTNSLMINFICEHNKVNDTWKVRPTSSADLVMDEIYYEGYDRNSLESMTLYAKNSICYSTKDILNNDGSTVFYQAPKLVLAPVMGTVPMKGALRQVMDLVPICLALLAGFLGLRKALSILQAILHKA